MLNSTRLRSVVAIGKLPLWLVALALWLVPAGNLWAGPRKGPEPVQKVEQGYMLPYVLTAVAVTLGVAAVCFPSQRKSEVDFNEEE